MKKVDFFNYLLLISLCYNLQMNDVKSVIYLKDKKKIDVCECNVAITIINEFIFFLQK